MLKFYSAAVRSVNAERGAAECIDVAFPDGVPSDVRAVLFNATLGHKLDKVGNALETLLKGASHGVPVFGQSGCAVTGREGVGESMHELGIMAVAGSENEVATAAVSEIYGHNSYEKGLELAKSLKAKNPNVTALYLSAPGIDIDNTKLVKAFVEQFGEQVEIFGGTSSDNMRGLYSYQFHDGKQTEHDAAAIGFADPTLKAVTRATHGFSAYGEPLTATKCDGNKVFEFDGKGAWSEFTARLGKPADSTCGDTIPVGALAEALPPDLAEEYGNGHILRVVTKHDGETIYLPTTAYEGLKLWLTTRDEELIFAEQARTLDWFKSKIGTGKPVAVFQTDCLARGRFLFNRIVKDELIAMMQDAFQRGGVIPAWLGNYGFGEYTKLGGKNTYHNYSTALMVLYR
ncbi:MAG: hypothetical protein LBN39_10000 [Planctomycetaceae bacterium]|nr:hypothetical protein [Planctomycetaceae bacterium]